MATARRPREFHGKTLGAGLLLAAALAACGGGGGGGSAEPPSTTPSPVITVQPQDVSVQAGSSLQLQVTASHATSYQWLRQTSTGWEAVASATSATLTLPAGDASLDGAQFRVSVRGASGLEVLSSVVTVHVVAQVLPPGIDVQLPDSVQATEGQGATFFITAHGSDLRLQWQTSPDGQTWTDVPEATAASWTWSAVSAGQNGQWVRVRVSNTAGTLVSQAARLSVQPAPQVPALTLAPGSLAVVEGQAALFRLEASGQPAPAVQWQEELGGNWTDLRGATASQFSIEKTTLADHGRRFRAVLSNSAGRLETPAVGLTVTTQEQAPAIVRGPSRATVSSGTQLDLSAVVTGTPAPSLQWQYSDNGGQTWQNINGATSDRYRTEALRTTLSQRLYRLQAVNVKGVANTNPVSFDVLPQAPMVAQAPASIGVSPRQPATFAVDISGDPVPSLQWQERAPGSTMWQDIPGAQLRTYTLPSASAASDNGRAFRVRATSTAGALTTEAALLTVSNQPTRATCTDEHWCWVSSILQGEELHALAQDDAGSWLAVGEAGTVVRTDDGGRTWQQVPVPLTARLRDVALRADGVALAVGEGGTLMRSLDRGLHWSAVDLRTNAMLNRVVLHASGLAVVAGDAGTLFVSTDAGASWRAVSVDATVDFQSALLVDDQTLLVGGVDRANAAAGGLLLRSNDGGGSWTLSRPGTATRSISDLGLWRGLVVAVGPGGVHYSADLGQSWVDAAFSTVSSAPGWPRLVRLPGSLALLDLQGAGLWSSADGRSWTEAVPLQKGSIVLDQLRAGGTDGSGRTLLLGTGGRLIAMDAAGALLDEQEAQRNVWPVRSLSFGDGTTGLAAASSNGQTQRFWVPKLLRSTDGGQHWSALYLDLISDDDVRAVSFPTPTRALAATARGRLLLSADAGRSWQLASQATGTEFTALSEGPSSAVLATGYDTPGSTSKILRSADSGGSWSTVWSAYRGGKLQAVAQRAGRAVAVGQGQTRLYSQDGGQSWREAGPAAGGGALLGVALNTGGTALAVGVSGQIQRSTDGGQTWHLIRSGGPDLQAIRFLSEQQALAVGLDGQSWLSTDEGLSWQLLPRFTRQSLFAIGQAGSAWLAGGDHGAILRHTDDCTEPACRAAPQSSSWQKKRPSTAAPNAAAAAPSGWANARTAGPGTR